MDFRGRLVATLRAIAPVLEEPGVLVIGSEIPNLLQPGAASTLGVSQDIDVGVPLERRLRAGRWPGARRAQRRTDAPLIP